MNHDGPTTGCTACNDSSAPRLLHNVRHRGVFHRLCTSCVLKFHPASFCPTCLDVFDQSPPSDSVRCSKCTSVSHSACVAPDALDSSYICPSCSTPRSRFFKISALGAVDGGQAIGQRSIDLKSAKVLLAAARIAAASMGRAVTVARIEVERKVREATVSRKRVREALERVALIASAEKEKSLKGVLGPVPAVEHKKKPKENSAVTAALAAQKLIQDNKSGGFSASFTIGSKVKDKLAGFHTPLAVQRVVKGGEEMTKLKGPSTSRQQQHSENSHVTGEEGKMKLLTNSEMGPPQLPQLKQDASVSKANSGVIFTSSPNTTSLIS